VLEEQHAATRRHFESEQQLLQERLRAQLAESLSKQRDFEDTLLRREGEVRVGVPNTVLAARLTHPVVLGT
jgi:hypothetical protein